MRYKKPHRQRKGQFRPLALALVACCCSAAGCTWDTSVYEDFVVNGEVEKCEGLNSIIFRPNKDDPNTFYEIYYTNNSGTKEYVGKNDQGVEDSSILKNTSINYKDAFNYGICPAEANKCSDNGNDGKTCTPSDCANMCFSKCVASFDTIHIKNCNDKENQIIACVDNWSDCDGEVMNGCEYNLSPNNALDCTYDRETQTSELVCEDGWADCNGDIQDGCEYDLVTNNALSCVNKQVTCLDNSVFSDCDGNYKNGCEYDIVSHNAVACHNKTVSCKNNYGDCNNYYLDGCEVDLLSNLSNCGACTLYTGEGDNKVVTENHACESGKVCNGFGECTDSCAAGSVFCGTSCVNTATNHIDASGVGCEDITDDEGNAYTKIYCVSNYTNCDDNPENGCEFILSSANAESCEHKTVVCQNGWGNCDGDYLNGCEYNLANNHALTCTWSESDVSLECMNDYAHFTDDYNDGCEFQLSRFNARSYTMTVDDDGTKHITFECISDFADCDGDYTNGCEYPLSSNNAKKCERKTNETSGEIEAVLTCSPNMADCDGNYLNGCEYNMKLSNVTSCKYNADFCEADGVDCNDETGDAITKRGIITCVSSFADMDKDYQNGCEIDGSTNLEHCGAKGEANDDDPESENYKGTACPSGYLCDGGKCGVSCTDPLKNCGGFCLDFEANNIATCDQSVSKLSAANCAEGWADGDGLLRNGCEYNLDAHHAEACQDRVLTCKEGYEDCNSNYLDGCEVDVLGTDPNHCGICGRVCSDIANVSVGTCYAGECKAVECDPNHHISSTDPTACVANTATKCAATHVADNNATDCTTANHAADGSCEAGGICKITKCQTGYHLSNTAAGNICVPNSLTACAPTTSAVTKDCLATDHLVAGTCDTGACSATKCAVGYYLDGTTCKPNAADKCSADGSATTIDCNTANYAAAGTCEAGGICKITTCAAGYHLSSEAAGNVCVPNSLSACAAVNSATTKDCTITDHLVAGECNNGTCEATQCAVGYNLNGTTCVASSATACSPDGISSPVNCNTANNAAAGTCESTGMCKISKCKTGYHLSSTAAGNVCVENSLTACAKVDSATTIDCTTTAHLVAGACNNGTCSATKCAVGYYLDGTTCKLNAADKCSADGSATTVNCNSANNAAAGTCESTGMCKITKCKTGYHLSSTAAGNVCVENSLTACAKVDSATTIDCTDSTHNQVAGACNNGTCSATKCAVGYYLDGTTCKLNAADKCSADGSASTINCNSANNAAAGTCEAGGVCKITKCKTGYHLSSTAAGNVCVENSLTACAAVNSATIIDCTDSTHNQVAGKCNNGTCSATKCAIGYYLKSDGTCANNTPTLCSSDGSSTTVNCNEANNASAGSCSDNGICQITTCDDGYHLSATTAGNICIKNTLNACGAKNEASTVDCTDKDHNLVAGTCENGTCSATRCAIGYNLNGTTCVASSETACSPDGVSSPVNCNTANNAAAGTCESNGKCLITACKTGFHLSSSDAGNVCIANSLTACAAVNSATTTDCTAANIVAGSCNNGTCSATKCAVGYYLNGTKCEPNKADKCSADGSATTVDCNSANNAASGTCAAGGVCNITKCKTGYHLSSTTAGNICVKNTLNACGADNSATTKDCITTDHLATGSCNNGTCSATQCAVGYYLDETSCKPNDDKSCSSDGSAAIINCNTANHATEGKCGTNGICIATKCQAGYYLNGTSCDICPAGTYAASGATECTACSTGKISKAGSSSCDTTCKAGTYANSTHTACETCPAGTISTEGADSCTQCEAGKYAAAGAAECSTCEANQYSAAGAASCSNCPKGTYSNPGAASCFVGCSAHDDCTAGTGVNTVACVSNVCTPTECAAGYYLNGTSCDICPAGTYSAIGASSCMTCPTGNISSAAGSESCNICEAGKYANSTHTACETCPAGSTSSKGSDSCTQCAAGKYAAAGATECSNCAANTYSTAGAASCTPCPDGTYSAEGSASCNLECTIGTQCTVGTGVETMACNGNKCEVATCKAGYYLDGGVCVACPAGTYKTSANNQGIAACIKCDAGKFSADVAQTEESACANCAVNTYSTAGSASCTNCPTGTYSAEGSASCNLECTSKEQCAIGTGVNTMACNENKCEVATCQSGYYLDGGVCVACPVGTYKTASDANGLSSCTECAQGTYSNTTARTTACDACEQGTYASSTGSRTCANCPANTYAASTGATSCTPCAVGETSDPGSSSCSATTCDPGSVLVNGACTPCPAGTYAAAGATSCTTCATGTISTTAGSTSCATTCEAGKYANATHTACEICPAGSISTAGADACTQCEAGKYAAAGATECSTCAVNTYSTTGSASCTTCPDGTYSEAGASSCSVGCIDESNCTKGTGVNTMACNAAHKCEIETCSAGYYLTSGSCVICPAGSYAAVGSTECSACADGSISPAGSAECTTCTSGYEYNHIVCLPSCPTGYEPVGNACIESSTLASCGEIAHGEQGCTDNNEVFTCNNGSQVITISCASSDQDGHIATCNPTTHTCDRAGCDEALGYHLIDGSCQQCPENTKWKSSTNACETSCESSYAICHTDTGIIESCDDEGFVTNEQCDAGCDSSTNVCSNVYCKFIGLTANVATGQLSTATDPWDEDRRFICGTSDSLTDWRVPENTIIVDDNTVDSNHQYHADFSPALASGTKCAFEILVGSNWYACGVNDWNTVQITDSTTVSDLPVLTISAD